MRRRPIRICALSFALCALASCAIPPAVPVPVGPGGAEALDNPFAPASLHIHPLTRVERDAEGKLWIICHVELLDAWGDTAKGIGQLQVRLFRPAPTPAAPARQELNWDVNLSDLKENSSLYDSPTRTYRLPLQNAPQWVGAENGRPRIRLVAILTTRGPAGQQRTLQDEHVVE
ncbi:MAG: hypothetical protein WD749_05465 [Phycisphaerales bacterium]